MQTDRQKRRCFTGTVSAIAGCACWIVEVSDLEGALLRHISRPAGMTENRSRTYHECRRSRTAYLSFQSGPGLLFHRQNSTEAELN